MFRTIDRYVIREIIPPALISLLIFTFTLELRPLKVIAEPLIEQGASWATVGRAMAVLVPQALGLTLPMSLLVGLLVALGRFSTDREYVALQACGISLYR